MAHEPDFVLSCLCHFLNWAGDHTRSHPDFDTYLFYYLAYSPFSFLWRSPESILTFSKTDTRTMWHTCDPTRGTLPLLSSFLLFLDILSLFLSALSFFSTTSSSPSSSSLASTSPSHGHHDYHDLCCIYSLQSCLNTTQLFITLVGTQFDLVAT